MKANTKSTTKKTKQQVVKVEPQVVSRELNRDVRDAVLVVSLVVNAYLFIGWLVLMVSNHRFDSALISYLRSL